MPTRHTGGRPHEHRRRRAVWTSVILAIVVVGALLALSMIRDRDGRPIVSEPMLVQTLITLGALAAVALPILLRTAADSSATRDQVQNTHSTNLREEGDERHAEIVVKLEGLGNALVRVHEDLNRHDGELRGIRDDLRGTRNEVEGLRGDVRRQSDTLRAHSGAIDTIQGNVRSIEDTWPGNPRGTTT